MKIPKKLFFIVLFFLLCNVSFAQKELLQSGPMVGYSQMKEVMLWVQTKKEAEVKIEYWEKNNPQKKFFTSVVKTTKNFGFTAKLLADSVEPGLLYQYVLYINKIKLNLPYATSFQTQSIWEWRTEPPDFKFASGSCAYINEQAYDRQGVAYGSEYNIFPSILSKTPDFMIWQGDNLYLREPDWNTRTGIIHRYTHTRSLPEMQPLLASVHNYAIWDDHDAGPNDCDASFWNMETTLEAFGLFWANPSFGIRKMNGAICTFSWNDVDFFLLDNRYYRSTNKRISGERTILGKEQLQWLKDALVYSNASFKIIVIGGQFLNTAQRFENYSNNGFLQERNEIIKFIYDEKIKNVVFLSGDRHFTEMSMLKTDGNPTIYDVTVSPLTSGVATSGTEDVNTLRMEGTFVMKRNFSLFEFSGPLKDRQMNISIFDSKGNEIWKRSIKKEQ